jgi:hypothetical protein
MDEWIAPCINPNTKCKTTVLPLRKETLEAIEKEAVWAPKPVKRGVQTSPRPKNQSLLHSHSMA